MSPRKDTWIGPQARIQGGAETFANTTGGTLRLANLIGDLVTPRLVPELRVTDAERIAAGIT
jgi:hypothetical protein